MSFSAVPCYPQSHDVLSVILILIYFLDDIAHLEEDLISLTLFLEPEINAVLFPVQIQSVSIVLFIF